MALTASASFRSDSEDEAKNTEESADERNSGDDDGDADQASDEDKSKSGDESDTEDMDEDKKAALTKVLASYKRAVAAGDLGSLERYVPAQSGTVISSRDCTQVCSGCEARGQHRTQL